MLPTMKSLDIKEETNIGQVEELRNEPDISLTKSVDVSVEVVEDEKYVQKEYLVGPVLICCFIAFGGFLLGWDIGTIGGIIFMPSFQNSLGTEIDPLTGAHYFSQFRTGLIVSIFNLAAMFGGIIWPRFTTFWGRRGGLGVTIIVYFIGAILQLTVIQNWIQFLVGRILTGSAVGSFNVIVPMYIAEIAPRKIRGSMVATYQIMITIAIVLGSVTNFLCKTLIKNERNTATWRIQIGLTLLWSCLIALGVIFSPESPEYLLKVKNDILSTQIAVGRMNNVEMTDPLVTTYIQELSENGEIQSGQKGKWHEFITGAPKLGYRLLIGVLVMSLQQLSGINYFFYYGTAIFQNVGIDDPYITAIIIAAIDFVTTIPSIYLIERLGRQLCLIVGSGGMLCSILLFTCTGSFALDKEGVGYFMLSMTCVYVLFFAAFLGPASFVLMSELFPIRTRVTSMSICASSNWLMNFLISLFTPLITSKIGYKFGFVFTGCLAFSLFVDVFMVPETKGKTEHQINDIFRSNELQTSILQQQFSEIEINID